MQDPIKIYEKVESLDHLKWIAADMLEVAEKGLETNPHRWYSGNFILTFNKQLILVIFLRFKQKQLYKIDKQGDRWNTDHVDIYINYTINNPIKKIFHKIFSGKDRKELEVVLIATYNNIEKFTETTGFMYTNSKVQQDCYRANMKFRKDLCKIAKQAMLAGVKYAHS